MYGVCRKIICDAPATLSVKGLMTMMMIMKYGVSKCVYEFLCVFLCFYVGMHFLKLIFKNTSCFA